MPPERRPPTHTTNPSNVTGSGIPSAVRSPTIQPITRSSSRGAPFDSRAAAELVAGFRRAARGWRSSPARSPCCWPSVASSSGRGRPPARWESQPAVRHAASAQRSGAPVQHLREVGAAPGADIFLDGKPEAGRASPRRSACADRSQRSQLGANGAEKARLRGLSAVHHHRLADLDQPAATGAAGRAGFLPPVRRRRAAAATAAAAEPGTPGAPAKRAGDSQAKAKRHGKDPPRRPASRGKGEIVDPFSSRSRTRKGELVDHDRLMGLLDR